MDPSVRLREAIIEDNLANTLRLLKRFPGLLYNVDPSNGWSNLHYASNKGHYLIASNLIKMMKLHGSEENEVKLTFQRETYLHVCVNGHGEHGNEQTLHLLLQNFGSLINLQEYQGRTVMHLSAIVENGSNCMQLLVDLGADHKIQDVRGNTAMHYALMMGHINCVKVLLTGGVTEEEEEIQNVHGFTPLEVSDSFDTIKLYEYFKKSLQESNNVVLQFINEGVSTPLMQKFSFVQQQPQSGGNALGSISSASSTPSKTLPPLPSVTTNRRYSNSITSPTMMSSPIVMEFPPENGSALSLSSSETGSFTNASWSAPQLARSRSTSLKSDSSPNKVSLQQQPLIRKKKSSSLDEWRTMEGIQEETATVPQSNNSNLIRRLTLHSPTGSSIPSSNVLKILIRAKPESK